MGRPTTYDGKTATWTRGKLTRLFSGLPATGTDRYDYVYNAYGQRVSRSYVYTAGTSGINQVQMGQLTNCSRTYHYDHAGRLIVEEATKTFYNEGTTSEKMVFLYDDSGIIGMDRTANGTTTTYYFQRDLQGNVISIYDASCNFKAKYLYDAWGNCTIASETTDYDVANANPIRYRGYYYDSDTGLYYLNARYYSPKWRRFISPDSTEYLDPESINGLNLYCYCNNDPVNYVDPSGCFALTAFGIWAVVGLVSAATLAGGVAQLASNALAGETGSELWRGVAGSALGSGINALLLCVSPLTGVASLGVSAIIGASVQTGIDMLETFIRGEDVALGQAALDLGINFATMFVGNWIGAKIIPTNAGWFKPQKFLSVFLKPYGQKILLQTALGAGLSAMINYGRKFDWNGVDWKNVYSPILVPPVLS